MRGFAETRGVGRKFVPEAVEITRSRPATSLEGVQLLELARNAQKLFEHQEPHEKHRRLNFVLSNCTWEGVRLVATFRQSFDLFYKILPGTAHCISNESASAVIVPGDNIALS